MKKSGMGVTAKGSMAKQSKETIAKVSQPGFNATNKISPEEKGNKVKGTIDKSMFSSDALGSGPISPNSKFAAKKNKKAGGVDKGVFACKSNSIWPDGNY